MIKSKYVFLACFEAEDISGAVTVPFGILRRCHVLLLDEATASIDNASDASSKINIRTQFQFADSTVITVAHRIRHKISVVLAVSDG